MGWLRLLAMVTKPLMDPLLLLHFCGIFWQEGVGQEALLPTATAKT
jgi:hypothetical protein